MLVRRPEEVDDQTMTMPGAEGVTMKLMVGRDDGVPNFAMRLFTVQPGGQTPKHAHNYEHEVMIVEGQAQVFDATIDAERPAKAGEVLYIPANQLHQFRNASDARLRFMCMVPTSYDCSAPESNSSMPELAPTPGS
ncbi:MAG: cupin domain-containing protein [Planctomycetota bacterium]